MRFFQKADSWWQYANHTWKIWAVTWDFQQCSMCDEQRLRPAFAYAQSDQSLCSSLEYSMNIKLLTEHHFEFLSLKGGCTGLSESIHVKIPHCWKSHVAAQCCLLSCTCELRFLWFGDAVLLKTNIWKFLSGIIYNSIFQVPFRHFHSILQSKVDLNWNHWKSHNPNKGKYGI